ncbi:hypothetical protein ACLOJK_008298 [Asimina triloba]
MVQSLSISRIDEAIEGLLRKVFQMNFEVINDPPAMVKGRRGEAANVGHPVEGKHCDGAVGLDDVGMDLLELGFCKNVSEKAMGSYRPVVKTASLESEAMGKIGNRLSLFLLVSKHFNREGSLDDLNYHRGSIDRI